MKGVMTFGRIISKRLVHYAPAMQTTRRFFSSTPPTIVAMDIVKRIKQDLVDADVNRDERVDFEELKLILSKYSHVFSEDDVQTIGELLFVGKGGKSVTHTTFLRGVLHTASADNDRENPLGLESCSDERCFKSESDNISEFYNTQEEFDKQLMRYIQELVEHKNSSSSNEIPLSDDDNTHEPTSLLAMDVVRRIKQDVVEADVNRDERLDFQELKLILSKYPVFTEEDVQTISDLFYMDKDGKSVTHTTFLRETLQTVYAKDKPSSDKEVQGQVDSTTEEFHAHLFKYIQEIVELKSTNSSAKTAGGSEEGDFGSRFSDK